MIDEKGCLGGKYLINNCFIFKTYRSDNGSASRNSFDVPIVSQEMSKKLLAFVFQSTFG